jgi:hypothetical protein
MNEEAQSDLLQEHEVLFLDFMGFAAAVQQWDDDGGADTSPGVDRRRAVRLRCERRVSKRRQL